MLLGLFLKLGYKTQIINIVSYSGFYINKIKFYIKERKSPPFVVVKKRKEG